MMQLTWAKAQSMLGVHRGRKYGGKRGTRSSKPLGPAPESSAKAGKAAVERASRTLRDLQQLADETFHDLIEKHHSRHHSISSAREKSVGGRTRPSGKLRRRSDLPGTPAG